MLTINGMLQQRLLWLSWKQFQIVLRIITTNSNRRLAQGALNHKLLSLGQTCWSDSQYNMGQTSLKHSL